MASTKQASGALVARIGALEGFDDVRAYPLQKIRNQEFFKDIPDLRPPACLVVFKGFDHTQQKRVSMWSAVVVFKDARGESFDDAADTLDALIDDLLDAELLDGALWVRPDAKATAVSSDPKYSVFELAFETSEES